MMLHYLYKVEFRFLLPLIRHQILLRIVLRMGLSSLLLLPILYGIISLAAIQTSEITSTTEATTTLTVTLTSAINSEASTTATTAITASTTTIAITTVTSTMTTLISTVTTTSLQSSNTSTVSTTSPQSTSNTQSTATSSGCAYPTYKGDGFCNDESNNANCQYDGGDCCGGNVDTSLCTQCQCLDPAFSMTTPSTTSIANTTGELTYLVNTFLLYMYQQVMNE